MTTTAQNPSRVWVGQFISPLNAPIHKLPASPLRLQHSLTWQAALTNPIIPRGPALQRRMLARFRRGVSHALRTHLTCLKFNLLLLRAPVLKLTDGSLVS